jgi:ubiquinone/menaquinone biosynthesis C-methylase UbiE
MMLDDDELSSLRPRYDLRCWRSVVAFVMSRPPNSFLLDVGCGPGLYLNLAPSIVDIGLDPSPEHCRLCAKKGSRAVLRSPALCLPFRDRTFDHAICVRPLQHFESEADRVRVLREICRVLRIGGSALVSGCAIACAGNGEADAVVDWDGGPAGDLRGKYVHFFADGEFERLAEQIPFFECFREESVDGRLEASFVRIG